MDGFFTILIYALLGMLAFYLFFNMICSSITVYMRKVFDYWFTAKRKYLADLTNTSQDDQMNSRT